MRVLIIALVAMIVLVGAGTSALIIMRLQNPPADTPTTPPSGKPPAKPTDAKPTERLPVTDPEPDRGHNAEELPPRPELSKKSKFTALDKNDRLFLEVGENGEKRVLFVANVCVRGGVLLEVFCCKKDTKEHESILNVDLDARFIHAALLGAGTTVGKPVQFVNPKTLEAEYKPASGQKVGVQVVFHRGGNVVTQRAQEWIHDENTKKPMAHDWVFAGSRFVKDPDRPKEPEYYTANNGEVIAISNFVDSMLDLPVEVGREERDLFFKAIEKKIPPVGSKVWVVLTPIPEEKKKDEKK